MYLFTITVCLYSIFYFQTFLTHYVFQTVEMSKLSKPTVTISYLHVTNLTTTLYFRQAMIIIITYVLITLGEVLHYNDG